ncbi:hypothetical protein AB0C34_25830 [Nocardia sp. NPDC049220]|uniref:hypothetical protein n=1 Tax=Nocardia sp. NPDC049220 TaxID=3155273 RepID=UPI0034117EB0
MVEFPSVDFATRVRTQMANKKPFDANTLDTAARAARVDLSTVGLNAERRDGVLGPPTEPVRSRSRATLAWCSYVALAVERRVRG